jgi:hypothetical protein
MRTSDRPPASTAAETAPWKQTRASFHAGKNLHGSVADPRVGRASPGDQSGFFTSAEESHADFYANSDQRNAEAGVGDIYAALPPVKPLDLRIDRDGVLNLVDVYLADATRLDTEYLDGRSTRSPGVFVRAAMRLEVSVAKGVTGGRLDGMLRDAAIAHSAVTRTAPVQEGQSPFDTSYLNRAVAKLGYDAFITEETNPATQRQAKVTVYLERPALVSHREEVCRAVHRGEPVPALVKAEYAPYLQGPSVPGPRPSRAR